MLKVMEAAGYLPWALGLCFVACAVWLTLKHDLIAFVGNWASTRTNQTKRGSSRTIPALFLLLVAGVAMGFGYRSVWRYPGAAHVVEWHNVYVVQDRGQFDYKLRFPDGTMVWTTFCDDYEPQFSQGQTLLTLKYEDRGVCWSVANTHPAYLILKDEYGNPIRK